MLSEMVTLPKAVENVIDPASQPPESAGAGRLSVYELIPGIAGMVIRMPSRSK
jgi:hypothetical protein